MAKVLTKYDDDMVDMELVKKAWDEANAKKRVWSPKEGTYQVRILPPTTRGLYYKEFGLHWDVALIAPNADRRSVACLKLTLGQDCPICKAVDQVYSQARQGKYEDKLAIKTASKVFARKRYVVNMIDVDLVKDGVKIWSYPPTAYNLIHPIFTRWGDVSSPNENPDKPKEGQVLEVTFTTKDKFTSATNVQITGDKSEIPLKDWREKRHDLDAYIDSMIVPASTIKEWFAPEEKLAVRIASEPEGDEDEKVEDDDASSDKETEFDPDAAMNDPEVQRLLKETLARRR